jgi:hypothetical protein
MQFCTGCGGALNLFETNDEGLCASCWRKKPQTAAPLSAPALPSPTDDDLATAVLSFENNSLVLTSEEGWVLWSSPCTEKNDLQTIMKRARRIYEIRKKRTKN